MGFGQNSKEKVKTICNFGIFCYRVHSFNESGYSREKVNDDLPHSDHGWTNPSKDPDSSFNRDKLHGECSNSPYSDGTDG